jgi:predicted nucleotidyltransferase
MLDHAQLDKCAERFAREPSLVAAWIFGSVLTDRFRENSDVDFALYYKPGTKMDWTAFGKLAWDLEDILGHRPDLGRLDSRNLIYAMQAFQTGRLLYAADEEAAMAFVSRLQSLYLDLKKDRKVVEEAYCA